MGTRHRMQSRHLLITAVVVAALALASALAALACIPGIDAAGGVPDHVTIRLREIGDSGVSGKATLRSKDGVTTVSIRITGPDGAYPAHIQVGNCGEFTAMPAFPLADADPTRITRTVVDVPLADLLAGRYVVTIHRPAADLTTLLDPASVVACGAIAAAPAQPGEAIGQPPVTGVGTAIAEASFGGLSAGMTGLAVALAGAAIVLRRTSPRVRA
jgi:hypothetical protein